MEKKIKIEPKTSDSDSEDANQVSVPGITTFLEEVGWDKMKQEVLHSTLGLKCEELEPEANKDCKDSVKTTNKQEESSSLELKKNLVEDLNEIENEIAILKKTGAVLEYFRQLAEESDSENEEDEDEDMDSN